MFHEFLMPVARHGAFQGTDQRLSFVHDRATWHNFSIGATRNTGNPLDVSIDGDAFLVVQTPRGERYTRNGSMQINANGELVTQGGDRVLGDGGAIQFQQSDSNISINPDGTITVREGGNAASDSARGKLRLVRFERTATPAEGRRQHVPRAGRHRAAAGRHQCARRPGRDRAIQRARRWSRWRA